MEKRENVCYLDWKSSKRFEKYKEKRLPVSCHFGKEINEAWKKKILERNTKTNERAGGRNCEK